jgi:hypothetical protein
MRTRYLLGVIAVLVLLLAIWLVPMALAAAGGSNGANSGAPAKTQSQAPPSGTQCPFLQAHPWMDPHDSPDGGGSGSGAGSSGSSFQGMYY